MRSDWLPQPSSPMSQSLKTEKVLTIGDCPNDWTISAKFPSARGRRRGGAIEKRSTRLRTECDQLGIEGHCSARGLRASGLPSAPPPPLPKGGATGCLRSQVLARDREGRHLINREESQEFRVFWRNGR